MAKVTLEFDSVEEQDEIREALDGYKWKLVVWEIDQELRKVMKYDVSLLKPGETPSEDEYSFADRFRELLRDIVSDHKLVMD